MESLKDSCFGSDAIFESYYSEANAMVLSGENDSALTLLEICDSLISACNYKSMDSLSFNQYQLYNKLMLLTKDDEGEYFKYFVKALEYVCDDTIKSASLLTFQDVILNDSILFCFHKRNMSFMLNHLDEPLEGVFFRYIHFLDQFYRKSINGDKRDSLKIGRLTLKKVDSVLQGFFTKLSRFYNIEKKPAIGSLFDSFSLLLLHSSFEVNEDENLFFTTNFHIFMSYLDNDFTIINVPRHLLDGYLKESYGKQFFETGYGMYYSKLHKKRILLPKIEEEELIKVFKKLKIQNPKYK